MSEVRKYVKKPVVIEARQIDASDYDDMCDIVSWCGGRAVDDDGDAVIAIDTLEGTHLANPGDYIIKGIKSEFYPCKPDIFVRTYAPVEEDKS